MADNDTNNDNTDDKNKKPGAEQVSRSSGPGGPRPPWRRSRHGRRGANYYDKCPFSSTGVLPTTSPKSPPNENLGTGSGSGGTTESDESLGNGSKSPQKKTAELGPIGRRNYPSDGDKQDKDTRSAPFDKAKLRVDLLEALKSSPNLSLEDVLADIFGLQKKGTVKDESEVSIVNTSGQTLKSVGGLTEQVKTIRAIIKAFVQHKTLKETWGLEAAPRGILFHGPPGTGKTLLAHTIVGELASHGINATFLMRRGSDLFDKYVGESEKKIQEFFALAMKKKPSVVFLDELDALCPDRNENNGSLTSHNASVVCALLGAMETVPRGEVIVVGATNRPNSLDPALKRPGRFDSEIYFTLPNIAGRKQILGIHTNKWMQRPSGNLLNSIAAQTEGYTGADLEQLCRNAFNCALERAELELEISTEEGSSELSPSGSDSDKQKKAQLKTGTRPQRADNTAARGYYRPYKGYRGSKPRRKKKPDPFKQMVERMKVLQCDWELGLRASRRSCSDVFGNCVFSPFDLHNEMKLLLGPIAKELQAKLEVCFPAELEHVDNGEEILGRAARVSPACLKINPFRASGLSLTVLHFWTSSSADLIILNTHIVPAILASIDPEKTPSYLFDFKCIVRGSSRATTPAVGGVSSLFDQIDSATQNTCVLFAPSFPSVWDRIEQYPEVQHTFVQRYEATRGRQVVLILTSSGTSFLAQNLPDSLEWLKNCDLTSTEVRSPSDEERRGFFDVLLESGAKSSVTGIELLTSIKGHELFLKFMTRLDEHREMLVKFTKHETLGTILKLQGQLVLFFKNLSSTAGQKAGLMTADVDTDEMERIVFYQDYTHKLLVGVRRLVEQLKNPEAVVGKGKRFNSVYI